MDKSFRKAAALVAGFSLVVLTGCSGAEAPQAATENGDFESCSEFNVLFNDVVGGISAMYIGENREKKIETRGAEVDQYVNDLDAIGLGAPKGDVKDRMFAVLDTLYAGADMVDDYGDTVFDNSLYVNEPDVDPYKFFESERSRLDNACGLSGYEWIMHEPNE